MNSREKVKGYDCIMRHTMDSVRVRDLVQNATCHKIELSAG